MERSGEDKSPQLVEAKNWWAIPVALGIALIVLLARLTRGGTRVISWLFVVIFLYSFASAIWFVGRTAWMRFKRRAEAGR